ncbi:MAG: hypothetical protein HY079_06065 [Elusimicrobia bacterium]|nr:hypothetical protein [Elusimicrobiota bacterium]
MPGTRIYVVVNVARRESVVASSRETPDEFTRRLGPPRPAPLAHWPPEDQVFVDILADGMDPSDVDEFVALYLRSTSAGGWKTGRWTP